MTTHSGLLLPLHGTMTIPGWCAAAAATWKHCSRTLGQDDLLRLKHEVGSVVASGEPIYSVRDGMGSEQSHRVWIQPWPGRVTWASHEYNSFFRIAALISRCRLGSWLILARFRLIEVINYYGPASIKRHIT